MMAILNLLLDRSGAALIIFVAAAAAAGIFAKTPRTRAAVGIAAVLVALFVPISHRSAFEWLVSAVERPSAPGLLLLALFAISATTGRAFTSSAQFRFGTLMLVLGGLVLYPAAIGFLNHDTYPEGFAGYLLPLALAAILAYAIYRDYILVALALNVGILAFLLGAGRSLNLWDYVIDPVAWFFAIGVWITILIGALTRRKPAPEAAPAP
jgi:hypothetical protein